MNKIFMEHSRNSLRAKISKKNLFREQDLSEVPQGSSKEEAMTISANKPSLGKLSAIQPRKVMAGQSLVRESSLSPGQRFPMVLEPFATGVDLLAWARESRGFIERNLLER